MASAEKEIRQTYNLKMDEEGILHFRLTGSVNNVEDNILQAQLIKSDIESFIEEGKTIKILADLTPTGYNANYPTPAAKKIFIEIIENDKVEKIAFVIKNFLMSSIIRFIIGSSKMAELKIFKTREEATAWLATEGEEESGFHIEPE